MKGLTFAERVALDYVSADECEQIRNMYAGGATYNEIRLVTGRHRSTINRHLNGGCTHE
jgi:DNA invertase Pin-like site-specific DNA recombinase